MTTTARLALLIALIALVFLTLGSVNAASDSSARYDSCLQSGGGEFCKGFINP